MIIKILIISALLLVASYDDERIEYERIFYQLFQDDSSWQENFNNAVNSYKKFLKDYPASKFSPEAKLRIAELYQLLGQKSHAKPFLDDIIKNHAADAYYSIITHELDGEKTAAWALYWRAVWFKNLTPKKDLERIIKEFPESKKVVEDALIELKKYK